MFFMTLNIIIWLSKQCFAGCSSCSCVVATVVIVLVKTVVSARTTVHRFVFASQTLLEKIVLIQLYLWMRLLRTSESLKIIPMYTLCLRIWVSTALIWLFVWRTRYLLTTWMRFTSALKVLTGNSLQIISKIKSCLLWSSEIILVWLKNQGIFGIRERSMVRYLKSLWE